MKSKFYAAIVSAALLIGSQSAFQLGAAECQNQLPPPSEMGLDTMPLSDLASLIQAAQEEISQLQQRVTVYQQAYANRTSDNVPPSDNPPSDTPPSD